MSCATVDSIGCLAVWPGWPGWPADSWGLKSGAASCMAHRLRNEDTWGKRTAGYSPTSRYSNMSGRGRNILELMAPDFDMRLD
jgi:hypothetical protein